ncbi:geminin coiled-coil domain-containing protein 1 [Labrus mixtus]|uniref:geminin coiled-coil domain-containing protein 1 n=1 Tax=Labrus mixtus TaxID=508554 RepID=UPI0029C0952E|nr:geminin coiled-coil domain-containing protein 1 [Labrus mixtus]
METLACGWACDPCDPSDLREEASSVWDSQYVYNGSPPAAAALLWAEPISPHLQRNKQLQDVLLQREEELARLQEENNKLRQFFSSSFVRNLQQKAKKLTADGRTKLKRNLMHQEDGPLQTRSHQLLASQQVSKRVCRNLTAQFCSEFPETPASSSEPNLDLWVLRTLGLKDRDTIDTSSISSSSSSASGFSSLVYDAAASSSSPSEYSLNSSSTPSSVQSYCQTSTPQSDFVFSPADSSPSCTTSPGQRSDFTTTGRFESPDAVIRSYNTFTAFQSPPRDLPFSTSPLRAEICPQFPASSPVQSLQRNPTEPPAYWSPMRSGKTTSSQDAIQFSPPGERVHFSPVASSSPAINQSSTPSPSAGSSTPQTPRSRTDLAFSMCLSPSNSVKTHSFPQGQAFVRKDSGGRWNFTWVPKQGP